MRGELFERWAVREGIVRDDDPMSVGSQIELHADIWRHGGERLGGVHPMVQVDLHSSAV
jgi:hypothetical protein